jgi:hypothetical protein
MIEALGLKIIATRSPEWHYLRIELHETLLSGSKVISGGHTERGRQTGDLISQLPILESRLKTSPKEVQASLT